MRNADKEFHEASTTATFSPQRNFSQHQCIVVTPPHRACRR
eukprot:CAMPEP_0172542898 /NCGR_PEP_ID=MMETSP1067-20121228/13410_1 /TAXON_ID=265564 ORGANISM="Thalassiosira punctigera, Strain Tpunct2005C2" /NCGR_SAMPLE_ID=MMETSP1067 /ASSEMBLY_ACC=CAM_ASM_000444 /LENGTH=40 /DNA_ID= /DNA_START= /DNA_END= /DNA_ORIENTATION=